MSENFFNNSLNSNLNKPFGFNVIPTRTMQQVKDSAINLLKDVVKPITDVGAGKEEILDGSVGKQIKTYNNIINMVYTMTAEADAKRYRTIDIKS